MLQLASEQLQSVERELMVLCRPCLSQTCLHGGPVALGEMLADVALSLMWLGLSSAVLVIGLLGLGSVVAQFSFGACLRTPCRSELSQPLNSLWAVHSARTQLEFARTGADALRGREGLKGCWSARTCQLAMRTLRATAALAGLPLPPQRSLTSR